jgi:uncharacterized protein
VTESAAPRSWTPERRLARFTAIARRQNTLFLLGTGAVAVHLLDDAFLQPEPGTAAGDHLISGLVPLGVLIVLAVAYPRARAGARATIALVLGLFGLVTCAVEGGYHIVRGGLSGDDYTGLLALLGGLLLIALGVVDLWQKRRLDESRRRRYLRRSLVAVAAGVVGFEIVFPILFAYGYTHFGLDPRGTGESEGDPYRYGGERDVKAALAFLRSRPDVDPARIGGLGLSLGGELMLQTAGETAALKAVVSEGAGIRSIREQMLKPGALKWLSAPYWATSTAAIAVFSNHAPPPNLRDLVARITPRPVFLIYSGHPLGGEELNEQFYAAAGAPKTLWKIADAGHTRGLDAHPAQYEHRVVAFFDHALLGRSF